MKQQLLIENYTATQAALVESLDNSKNLYLSGRMMTGEQRNLNNRIYPREEIIRAVSFINEKAKEGNFICGELNHPDNLSIDLKNVSHLITEAYMDGDNAICKCKILNTPSGIIVRNLIEGGWKPGVSTRGTGSVTNEGVVESFNFLTIDVVANPSGPGCYPDVIRESVENTKILSLAEAVIHDSKAQEYLKTEINKFLEMLVRK